MNFQYFDQFPNFPSVPLMQTACVTLLSEEVCLVAAILSSVCYSEFFLDYFGFLSLCFL